MKRSLSFAICMLLTVPAFGQADAPASATVPMTEDFISKAAMSDMFEIQSSQLAGERADEATKTFAAQMITDHGKTTDELQKMLASNAVPGTIPTAMSSAQQAMLDKLKTLNGPDFVKQYRSDQVKAHQEAVSMFTTYANTGDHTGMREWAIKTLPALEDHLKMAQDLGS